MNVKYFSILFCSLLYTYLVCGSSLNDTKKNATDTVTEVTTVSPVVPKVEADPSPRKDNASVILKSHNETSVNTTTENPAQNTTPPVPPVDQPTITPQPDVKLPNTTVIPPQGNVSTVVPSAETTTKPKSTTTSTTPSSTTSTDSQTVVSVVPKTEEVGKDRKFDGPSFIGGIVLALGLSGIGFVAYKFCKPRPDRSYRNL